MKRIISLLLVLMMVLSLAGCGRSAPVEEVPTTEATQFTEAVITAASKLTVEKDTELRADLKARIEEILNSETEIVHSDAYIPGDTFTGSAYYVSIDGDDNNDGLTPETAWATLGKVGYESGGRILPLFEQCIGQYHGDSTGQYCRCYAIS